MRILGSPARDFLRSTPLQQEAELDLRKLIQTIIFVVLLPHNVIYIIISGESGEKSKWRMNDEKAS